MPVHTLRGIPRTFYASITSMCWSGLQDHPDRSPIEHLWDHLGRQVRERHDVNNIRDLRALQAEWARIPLQVIKQEDHDGPISLT